MVVGLCRQGRFTLEHGEVVLGEPDYYAVLPGIEQQHVTPMLMLNAAEFTQLIEGDPAGPFIQHAEISIILNKLQFILFRTIQPNGTAHLELQLSLLTTQYDVCMRMEQLTDG